jgi:hypothetical protein
MRRNILLRPVVLCSLVIAILTLTSCSKKADTEAKDAEKAPAAMPAGAMPLSAILQSIENSGYAPIVEAELEKDHWNIQAYKDGQLLQVKVDLMKGEIIPGTAPHPDKPLSAVIKTLEDQGYGPIADAEIAEGGTGLWEVEAYKGQSEVTLEVEPSTGKITTK